MDFIWHFIWHFTCILGRSSSSVSFSFVLLSFLFPLLEFSCNFHVDYFTCYFFTTAWIALLLFSATTTILCLCVLRVCMQCANDIDVYIMQMMITSRLLYYYTRDATSNLQMMMTIIFVDGIDSMNQMHSLLHGQVCVLEVIVLLYWLERHSIDRHTIDLRGSIFEHEFSNPSFTCVVGKTKLISVVMLYVHREWERDSSRNPVGSCKNVETMIIFMKREKDRLSWLTGNSCQIHLHFFLHSSFLIVFWLHSFSGKNSAPLSFIEIVSLCLLFCRNEHANCKPFPFRVWSQFSSLFSPENDYDDYDESSSRWKWDTRISLERQKRAQRDYESFDWIDDEMTRRLLLWWIILLREPSDFCVLISCSELQSFWTVKLFRCRLFSLEWSQ